MLSRTTQLCVGTVLLWVLTACSIGKVNPAENIDVFIDNMRDSSYDFNGKLQTQKGNSELEEWLVLSGTYVAHEGYEMNADIHLPGLDTESSILLTDDQLYYKLAPENNWKPTTEQDLRMLGVTYKESPVDLLDRIANMVLSVEPTEQSNVYQVVIDRQKYEEMVETDGVFRLHHVNGQAREPHVQLLENPIVDVEVDLERHFIRSLTLNYVLDDPTSDDANHRMNVSYEMKIGNFNAGQTLPDL